ncbi:uncharacterized protein LOC132562787 [Ylistrum balloti]|uniref:uncharacterized protein LOC132562787 n=1 Tax=Ylistrum balloti TaxID=509963 RepID=UPI002905AFBF|nr:uncharacterized protein LOC132562787 [Ylistrum balloti]
MNRDLLICVFLVIGYVQSAPSLLPVTEGQDDILCNICESMVEDLKSLVGENATESQVEDKLDDICNRLAADRDVCTSMVHQYLPALFSKISGAIDPKSACVELKVCSKTEEVISNETPKVFGNENVLSNEIPLDSETEYIPENVIDNVIPQFPHPYSGRKGKPVNIKQKLASNETCEICEFLIQVLDASIATNQTEAAINKTIMQICAALPAELSSFCKSITPALLNVLEKGVDPEKGCTTLRLCETSDGIVNMKSLTCDMCQTSMKEAFGRNGEKVCNEVRGLCKTKKAGSNAYKEPVKYNDFEEVSGGKMATIPNEEDNGIEANPLECELCKLLVDEIDQVLVNNRSEEVINATIYQLCGEVPGGMKNFCLTYAPRIVQLLETGFDPSIVCTIARACAATSTPAEEEPVETQRKGLDDILKDLLHNEINNPEDGKCDVCKAIIEIMDRYLDSNQTKDAINNTVYGLCASLPGDFQQLCDSVAPQVVVAVESGLDPTSACTFVKLCSSGSFLTPVEEEEPVEATRKEELEDVIKDLLPNEVNNPEDGKCDVCKAIIEIMDRYLDSNQTKDAINNTVYGLCASLPGDFQQLCDSVAPQVVIAVESGLDPSSACSFVKLCTSGNFKLLGEEIEDRVKDVEEDLEVGDTKCELCKLVINLVDQYIGRNTSMSGLNSTVYELCGLLPGDIKATCDLLAPGLVKAMESGFDPARACDFIKLCANDTMVEAFDEEEEEIEEVEHQQTIKLTGFDGIKAEIERTIMKDVEGFGDDKCDLCEFVINLLDQYIEKNSSQIAINNTVYELCGFLPSDIKAACNLFAPQLVKAMESGFDPLRACEAVGLCTNGSSVEPQLVEVEPIVEPRSQEEEEEPMGEEMEPRSEEDKLRVEEVEPRNEEVEPMGEEEEPRVEEVEPMGEEEESRVEEVEPMGEEEEPRVEEVEPMGEEEEPREEVEPMGEEEESRVEEVEPMGEEEEPRVEEVEPMGEEEEPREEEVEPMGEEEESIIGENDSMARHVKAITQPGEQHSLQLEESEEEHMPIYYKEDHIVEEHELENADARCELCELMIGIVDRYLEANTTQQKLNETVYNLCGVLPSTLKSSCLLIAPKVVSTIEGGLNPESACTQANFCVNGTELEFPIQVPGLTCEACHGIVELTNPAMYDVETADNICAASCPRRHRRSAPGSQFLNILQVLRDDPAWSCDVCEFMVKAVNVMLTDNQTIDKVTDRLMALCSYFPAPYAQTCKNSVVEVVEEFDKGIDVMKFCNIDNGNQCGNGFQDMDLLLTTLGKPEEWECNICKKAMSTMNSLLDQDYEQIKMYMSGVCERMSAPHNQQCHVYIQTQGDQVFNRIIERLLSPTEVCQFAGICSVKPQHHPNTTTPPFVLFSQEAAPPFVLFSQEATPPFILFSQEATPPFVLFSQEPMPPFVLFSLEATPPFVLFSLEATPPFVLFSL